MTMFLTHTPPPSDSFQIVTLELYGDVNNGQILYEPKNGWLYAQAYATNVLVAHNHQK